MLRRKVLATVMLVVLAGCASSATAGAGRLPYSAASREIVQRQPPPGSCSARGSGLYSRPDPRCTPGALNPAVRQSTVGVTICRRGWTTSIRPRESITEPEKLASMRAYSEGAQRSRFEYDHLIPLELGGAANDPRNLWPEPDYTRRGGFYLNPKDELENALKRLVCHGSIALSQAQHAIAADWVAAYRRYL